MTVFVDAPIHQFGRMRMCHMVAFSEAELHAMASQIGVARRWFQDPRSMRVSRPHYDIALSKRTLALSAGAVEIDKYQMVAASNLALNRLLGRSDFDPDPLRQLRNHSEFERVATWLQSELSK